jgi:hypothetical protein
MKPTAIYFNPERDTVHVVDYDRELHQLLQHSNAETIRSIKVLAMGGSLPNGEIIVMRRFESLETLIMVVEGEARRNEAESIRENMEGRLVKTRDRLVLRGKFKEWKLPTVKVMDAVALESLL